MPEIEAKTQLFKHARKSPLNLATNGAFVKIELSQRSQELLQKYNEVNPGAKQPTQSLEKQVDIEVIISFLNTINETITSPNTELLFACLCSELLKDLALSLPVEIEDILKEDEAARLGKCKFLMLVLAGILVVACEGFDGTTTILGLLSLPSFVVLLAGIGFSLITVIVFCGLDLIQVSRQFGIKLIEGPKLLDIYFQQMQDIKLIRRLVHSYCLSALSIKDLQVLELLLAMLQTRLTGVINASKQFELAIHGTKTTILKYLFTGMSGMLFFGGGFFAGQTVAAFVLGLFFVSTPPFWPILAFSCLVGLAALAVYWYMERPGLQKLISNWFGLDEEKIEQLCTSELTEKEQNKLNVLKNNVSGTLKLKQQVTESSDVVVFLDRPPKRTGTLTSANPYSFYKKDSTTATCVSTITDESSVICSSCF